MSDIPSVLGILICQWQQHSVSVGLYYVFRYRCWGLLYFKEICAKFCL